MKNIFIPKIEIIELKNDEIISTSSSFGGDGQKEGDKKVPFPF